MTVRELRELLNDLDADLEVVVKVFGNVDVPVDSAEMFYDEDDETGHIQINLER